MANATIVNRTIAHACGMRYHGTDPKKNLCANHSDSCQSKTKAISMCFAGKTCDICGYCAEHCVGHLGVKEWSDAKAFESRA